ncbi:hypothetical protein QQP08_018729 [Theobroma cacao]|nr:hypothetical protein QQP08_018729 [Theobroma cacao]
MSRNPYGAQAGRVGAQAGRIGVQTDWQRDGAQRMREKRKKGLDCAGKTDQPYRRASRCPTAQGHVRVDRTAPNGTRTVGNPLGLLGEAPHYKRDLRGPCQGLDGWLAE